MEVRELHLYSEKIEPDDVKNLFNRITKTRFPLFGFLEFSDILSLNAFTMVVKRNSNTVRFYIKDKTTLQGVSPLIFPYRLCDTTMLKESSGSFFPFPKLYLIDGIKYDILDFMLKENVEQLSVNITKISGAFIANGVAIDEKGRKGLVFIFNPQKFLRINLEKNPSIYIELLEPLPKQICMNSNFPVFEDTGTSLGVDNYDPLQHTIIAGTSGSGKSKALFVLLRAVEAKYKDDVRVVIVDPHGEFNTLFPNAKVVNFIDNYVEPLDVGREKSPMLTQLVSQLMASSIGQENKYSERVLFYAVHLLTSIGKLELNNISMLLTDSSVKAEYVSMCDNDEVKRFFDEEYNDIHIHHFNNAILPILNFIGEYQLYLGKEKKRENLLELINNNRVTVISFDPKFFGRRMISFLAGAVINQMYILAISRKLDVNRPTILVVDEFPRVETRVTKDILSETRKFGLFAYLSCQYLGQLSKEVVDSIVSNARNIIAFKINKTDAALLSSIMEIKVEEYFKKSRATTELEESKKDMFVRLHQRECIVRLFDGVKYLLPMKLKIVDVKRWEVRSNEMYREREQPTPAPGSAFGSRYSEPEHTPGMRQPPQMGQREQEKEGTPLRYRETQDNQEKQGSIVQREAPPPEEQEKEDEETEEEKKEEKPAFPDPMTENALLQETPDAIYQLEKVQHNKATEEANKAKAQALLNPIPPTPSTEQPASGSQHSAPDNQSPVPKTQSSQPASESPEHPEQLPAPTQSASEPKQKTKSVGSKQKSKTKTKAKNKSR